MEFSTFAGLPAHPLFVHVPIILIPLCALGLVAYLLLPSHRASWAAPLAVITVVNAIFTVLSAGAGEKLYDQLPASDHASATLRHHVELGDQTRIIVLGFTAVALIYLVLDWNHRRRPGGPGSRRRMRPLAPLLALGVLAVLLGGVATVWDVRTGHAGAKSAWGDVASAPVTPSAGQGDSDSDKSP